MCSRELFYKINAATIVFILNHTITQHHHAILGTKHSLHYGSVDIVATHLLRLIERVQVAKRRG